MEGESKKTVLLNGTRALRVPTSIFSAFSALCQVTLTGKVLRVGGIKEILGMKVDRSRFPSRCHPPVENFFPWNGGGLKHQEILPTYP